MWFQSPPTCDADTAFGTVAPQPLRRRVCALALVRVQVELDSFHEITSTAEEPYRALEIGGQTVAYAGVVANITGNPAMSVPLTWNADGLPVGVHFLGRYGDEATLFRLAEQLETVRPWSSVIPLLSAHRALDTAHQ